jgi:hypothetical protein
LCHRWGLFRRAEDDTLKQSSLELAFQFALAPSLLNGVTFRIIWRSLSAVFWRNGDLNRPGHRERACDYANRLRDLAKATVEACSMCVEESAEILFDYAKYR